MIAVPRLGLGRLMETSQRPDIITAWPVISLNNFNDSMRTTIVLTGRGITDLSGYKLVRKSKQTEWMVFTFCQVIILSLAKY